MTDQDRTGASERTTVTIDTEHLPGIVSELAARLSVYADSIEIDCSDVPWEPGAADLADLAYEATRARQVIEVLEQIGWRTDRTATVTADREFLAGLFAEIHAGALDQVSDIRGRAEAWGDPLEALTSFERAAAGAGAVLAQLEGVA
jgi:hypothetical protein